MKAEQLVVSDETQNAVAGRLYRGARNHPSPAKLTRRVASRVPRLTMARSVSSQNAKRAAVRKALDRHKIYITAQRFAGGTYEARVLVEGEVYWVDELRLSQLRAGIPPTELELIPEDDG
ncbi:hypothetical protein P9273_03770 [Mesorhizobium sp. WSM4935]|nr:hypothetical protein [Mesorhizobium sp. WSM4935]